MRCDWFVTVKVGVALTSLLGGLHQYRVSSPLVVLRAAERYHYARTDNACPQNGLPNALSRPSMRGTRKGMPR